MDPVRDIVKKSKVEVDDIITLASGVRVRLHPVSNVLIRDIQNRIPFPKPPIWHDPSTDRDEDNYTHPDYVKALQERNNEINSQQINAYVILGFDLVDGVPDKSTWLPKLKMLERLGVISLRDFDLEDDGDLEYLYRRYIATPTVPEIDMITDLSQLTPEEIAKQRASFRGETPRETD
jgi:hypothetical protein